MAKKYKNELSAFDMAGTVFENGVNTTEASKGRRTKKEKSVKPDSMQETSDGKRATYGAATPADDRPGKGGGPVLLLLRGICRRATYPKGIR